jgi:isocitrate dehydrogenase kinase/phosphatase
VSTTGERGADIILSAFDHYVEEFGRLTRQARSRFERSDWRGIQADSVERLELYRRCVHWAHKSLDRLLRSALHDKQVWRAIKPAYEDAVAARRDLELAETFLNSVTRRIFATVGVDPEIEFVRQLRPDGVVVPPAGMSQTFRRRDGIGQLVGAVLRAYHFSIGYQDVDRDAALVAAEMERVAPDVEALELARPVFFRNKGAYLVGALHAPSGQRPFVLALLNPAGQVVVDAVLLDEDSAHGVFSFTRSYFLVDAECPGELVSFLASVMPRRRIAELYNAIGYNKHGKTELYRALLRQLADSTDRFEIAPGARGMVMVVFTLPSHDLVFKIIRDSFDPPKSTTREEVRSKYHLVFTHDRAGRLVDAHEFEHLAFPRDRFSDDLLDELRRKASGSVAIGPDAVVLHHLYAERRLQPLDLHLRRADPEECRRAVLDYGQAIKDLAASNIFPGDLLLKNFGVTRMGRLVFYDYDELCMVTDCNFRELPEGHGEAEATGDWLYVNDRDVFPQEFINFLGLRKDLREIFLAAHGDLLDVGFWLRVQADHRAGRVSDIYPYPAERRLHRA